MMNHKLISDAIVEFVHNTFPGSVEQEIVDAYGPEIARDVRTVFDKAMDCPVNWNLPGMNMNVALGILADFMATKLTELSPEAKTRLNYCYIMCWK